MKNLFLLLLPVAVLFACSDDDGMPVGAAGIEMSAEPFVFAPGEEVPVRWSDKDTVGVFPEEGLQLYFPMVSGAGESVAQFDGGGWNLRHAGSYRAYFPFKGDIYLDYNKMKVSYAGQVQDGNAPRAHLKKYDFMSAVSESRDNGCMYFHFSHLGCLLEFGLNSATPFGPDCLELLSDDEALVEEGTVDLGADSVCLSDVKKTGTLSIRLENMEFGGERPAGTVYGMVAPMDLRGHELRVRVVDKEGFYAVFKFEGIRFDAGHIYRIRLDLGADTENATSRKVHVEKAGTLGQLLGNADLNNIRSLELSGELNGSDIRVIREMAGVDVHGNETGGRLQELDMKDARIVEGGGTYYEGVDYEGNEVICRTEDNVVGRSFLQDACLRKVCLPDHTTRIGEEAFDCCRSLLEVALPEGLEVIGKKAFSLCDDLVSVDIPESVVTLEGGVFFLCGNLSAVHFSGNNLRTVSAGVFNQCTKLRKVELPSSVETVGNTAFGYCEGLSSVRLSRSLKGIGETAFFNCYALKEMIIPGNQITFGKEIFYRCFDLKTIRFTNGELSVLEGNFLDGSSVSTLYLPDSLKEIKGTVLGNGSIVEVYCFAVEPPAMDAGNLPDPDCRIFVPEGSVGKYKAAPGWKEHADKVGKIPDGLENEWK